MNFNARLKALIKLGHFFNCFTTGNKNSSIDFTEKDYNEFQEIISKASLENSWFTVSNIHEAIKAWGFALTEDKIDKWLEPYQIQQTKTYAPKTIGVVMAGNLPLVGFHDFLSVLMTGHKFYGKTASDDNVLIRFIADILIKIEPGFVNFIEFTDDRLKGFDSIMLHPSR